MFDPVALANEPRGQGKQDALERERGCGLYVPAGQWVQLASEEAPRTDDHVPAGQSSQASFPSPVEAAYVPGSHCWQSMSEMEPLPRVVEPVGQGVQAPTEAVGADGDQAR